MPKSVPQAGTSASNVDRVRPLQRSRLVDEVTDRLREAILNGSMPPGMQLLQVDLAEQLGVSRTPLREAFRVLERDGLIRVSNGNKTVEVVAFTDDEILDMYVLREALDGAAARVAAQNGLDGPVIRGLRADLAEMERWTASANVARYGSAHAHFHATIGDSCGNRWVRDLVPLIRMSAQMTVSRRVMAAMEKHGDSAEAARARLVELLWLGDKDHRTILEAIIARDGRQAEAAARRHIRTSAKAIRQAHELLESVEKTAAR